jgi:hypothetical protein
MPLATRLSIAVLLILPGSAALAQDALYKCVDPAGVTSIQSDPCAKGSTQAWKRDTTPEAPPTPAEQAQAEARRLRDQQRVRELSQQLERRMREEAAAEAAAKASPPLPPLPSAANDEDDGKDDTGADAAVAACQDAQQFANAARAKEWLGLTDDQVRRLYNWVAQECKPAAGE